MTSTAHGAALLALFDRLYVINLDSRPDRRAEIAAQLARLGLSLEHPAVERVPALRPESRGGWRSIGARGCYESHLAVLDRAVAAGHGAIAILEDDMDVSPGLLRADPAEITGWRERDWAFLHGGHAASRAAPALVPLPPGRDLLQTHFIGLRGDAIGSARDHLRAMAARPEGAPEGGPMDVDGAYGWWRRARPDLPAVLAQPALAYQRASRTDVSAPGWKDRAPLLRTVIGGARRLRNRLRAI
ncbi:glycosyltransferase family 25 protein [Limimaricola pyoseonensis]|uniref:Glycosyl transferase, family 25 n=1 Tax=Limimaricola pyoseonensis TaxID=521013 RepID=A0A1G7EEY5_9RHOB|nr:glycosyltransferase family 25 protein [Limimaricola pyoseonensis]SDE62214.1 hypothetical protein SAMN04488567_2134 [Limimaricola pyoseonensis]